MRELLWSLRVSRLLKRARALCVFWSMTGWMSRWPRVRQGFISGKIHYRSKPWPRGAAPLAGWIF